MKKIFPVIIVLISLSLIGIILIQVSWFRSMLQNKREDLDQRVINSMVEVGQELIDEKGTLPPLKNSRIRPHFTWPSDQLMMELMKPTTVAEKFTEFEIKEKLDKAFNRNGLKNTGFEFAITSNVNMFRYEKRSSRFMNLVDDTTSNSTFTIPLQVPGGSTLEGLIPEEVLTVIVPNIPQILFNQMRWMLGGSVLFTLIIIAAFYVTVKALVSQKKLSEIKNDFINNMTHEFKTPLATISLAVDALKNEKVLQNRDKIEYFSGIIKEENKRMNKQVETILQAALLDRQEMQLNLKPIHVHNIIHAALDNFHLQLEEIDGKLDMQLNASYDVINADEVHFTNVIFNLVENAVKYSKEELLLKVITQSTAKNIVIKIEDNGIGMNKETLKRIFEKFYRAHTGNLHNVKGFGLGLSYVQTIVDAHHGKIKAESSLGKGTIFTLEMPLLEKQQAAVAVA
ncbi:MAG: HAMP domain-containing histidine kinase [Chitinophagaceae bacterium]|nr:HAMP domain-containing histidine kinase [Chitinophagaceae bacterium]